MKVGKEGRMRRNGEIKGKMCMGSVLKREKKERKGDKRGRKKGRRRWGGKNGEGGNRKGTREKEVK